MSLPAPVIPTVTAFPLLVIFLAWDATQPPMTTRAEPVHKRHGRQSAAAGELWFLTTGFRVCSIWAGFGGTIDYFWKIRTKEVKELFHLIKRSSLFISHHACGSPINVIKLSLKKMNE